MAGALLAVARHMGLHAIAIAMLMATGAWWLLNEWLLKDVIDRSYKEIAQTSLLVAVFGLCFWATAIIRPMALGLALYSIAAIFLVALLLLPAIRARKVSFWMSARTTPASE